jgi:hypothetical protein
LAPASFSNVKFRFNSKSRVWNWPILVCCVSLIICPETWSWELCGSKSRLLTRITRFRWTRAELVDPVSWTVVTRRIALARRMSYGRIRLYACH